MCFHFCSQNSSLPFRFTSYRRRKCFVIVIHSYFKHSTFQQFAILSRTKNTLLIINVYDLFISISHQVKMFEIKPSSTFLLKKRCLFIVLLVALFVILVDVGITALLLYYISVSKVSKFSNEQYVNNYYTNFASLYSPFKI